MTILSSSELRKKSMFGFLWQQQKKKYKEKGLVNTLIGVGLLYVIIVGGTELGRRLWPDNIQDPFTFTIVGTLMIHVCCQILYFLMFLPGYKGNSMYQRYLINKKMQKPWQKQNWSQMRLRTIFYLFLNKGIIFPLIIYSSMKFSGLKARYHDFPSALQVGTQLIIISVIEDFFFYWAHKLSHDIKFLYKYHKIHHEYEFVFSLAAQYTHPIDYILGILIPSVVPFVILGNNVHCFMVFFWQIWKIFTSSQGHSGFEFPWSPIRVFPLILGPSYHDFHHSKNVGNYSGMINFWDTLMNTNTVYYETLQKNQKQNNGQKQKLN